MQPAQQLRGLSVRQICHVARSVSREASSERGQDTEHAPVFNGEASKRSLERTVDGALPFRHMWTFGCEQVQPFPKLLENLSGRQICRPGSRQLQSQWDALHQVTEGRDIVYCIRGKYRVARVGLRVFEEKLYCVGRANVFFATLIQRQ